MLNQRLFFSTALALLVSCGPARTEKCVPSNCAGGCCDVSGACQLPSASNCGASGNLCAPCFGNQTCNFGVCVGTNAGGGGGTTGGGGGGVTGGGGGATGGGSATGGGGGTAASTFDPAGAWQLVLVMYYRDPVLIDGGMGRNFSVPPDSGMRVEAQHLVYFKADDAGGYGMELTLVDGGACCADGPRFQVDGGALLLPAQRYRFPPGISFEARVGGGGTPFSGVNPWNLDVLNYESRAATEVSGVTGEGQSYWSSSV